MSKITLRLKRKDTEAEVTIENKNINCTEAKELLYELFDLAAEKKKPYKKDDLLFNKFVNR